MPYTQMNLEEASEYLHLPPEQVEKLARQGEFPSRYAQNQLVFWKRELHVWASQRFLDRHKQCPMKEFHRHATEVHAPEPERPVPVLTRYLYPESVSPCLTAKTKSRALRELVKLAAANYHLTDDAEFLRLLEEREEICTTGLEAGVAMPHSQVHDEFLFLESVLVIARVPDGIPFGALDGKKTDLFIMPCANNDRLHLYMISRIALLLTKTNLAEALRECHTVDEILQVVEQVETDFVDRFAPVQ